VDNIIKQRGLDLDTELYKQILFNIIANACKFNKISGTIRVRLSASFIDFESVRLVTEIEDSGIGMDDQ